MSAAPLLRRCRIVVLVLAAASLGGCNALSRLADLGEAPPMTPIENPKTAPKYRPVSMPMPTPLEVARQPNSLWRPGARAFFKDQRASEVGDIITVTINIDEKGDIENTTQRSRTASEDASANSLLGYETSAAALLPSEVDPTSLLDLDSATVNKGSGSVQREEEIELKVAATITQVLPNGNLVLQGRQELRVNFEVRELLVAGIIRPEDITSDNTISFEKVAEARVAYGGRGQITDVQQPRYGQQFLDIIFPF